MDFVISFHQLSKRRPDCHQVRIIRVVVRIPSVAASANFAGTLTHWGRSWSGTRPPPCTTREAVRLIPTPAQVEQALREQRETARRRPRSAGSCPYALAPQPVPFGAPSDVTSQFTEFTLGAFEGYGPAGAWQLELRNVNVRNISDIDPHLRSGGGGRRDRAGGRVEPLVAAYEQELADQFVDGETLDRMTVLSLRRQFRDAFEALEDGTGTFELRREHFDDAGLRRGGRARVRTVIAQALDADGAGRRRGSTGDHQGRAPASCWTGPPAPDGFSEDLSQGRPPIQPPENRPPGPGTWQVRLPDPTQCAALDDLVLFFVCDFR